MSRICIPIPNSTVVGVSGGASVPDPKTIRNESQVTTVAGLKALPTNPSTAGYHPVGSTIFIVVSGVPYIYQLVYDVTSAESIPSVVWPTDHAASNNLWVQRM